MLIASLELGGTKTIAALGRDPHAPLATIRIPTRSGAETLFDVEAFFGGAIATHGRPDALGIATFGPIVLDRDAPDWGCVKGTVKPGWSGVEIAPRLARALGCPAALDTDVNAAALAEARLGAGQGCDPLVYLTIGTGIGGGLVVHGKIVHGLLHPEMGHVMLRRHPDDDYAGSCSYHGDCVEGLASGPSITGRFGVTLSQLAADHPFRAVLADYLGQLCAAVVLIASPGRIVMGGGVTASRVEAADSLHEQVAVVMRRQLAGYIAAPTLDQPGYVVAPQFDDAGLIGACLLGRDLA